MSRVGNLRSGALQCAIGATVRTCGLLPIGGASRIDGGLKTAATKAQNNTVGTFPKCFNRPKARPATESCVACWIIPGRKLLRYTARIPNSAPYTVIVTMDFTP